MTQDSRYAGNRALRLEALRKLEALIDGHYPEGHRLAVAQDIGMRRSAMNYALNGFISKGYDRVLDLLPIIWELADLDPDDAQAVRAIRERARSELTLYRDYAARWPEPTTEHRMTKPTGRRKKDQAA